MATTWTLLEHLAVARETSEQVQRETGGSRELSLAKTRLEEAEAWAKKAHEKETERG